MSGDRPEALDRPGPWEDDAGVDERAGLGPARVGAGCVLALVGTAALVWWLAPSAGKDLAPVDALLFLALAVACALVGGAWPALLASVLGTLALNYWFTRPHHSFSVASRENVATLAVFVVVSLAVAAVVGSAVRRRQRAIRARAEADTLAMLNRTVLGGTYDVPELLALVRATFGVTRAELLDGDVPRPAGPDEVVVDAGRDAMLVVGGRRIDGVERRVLEAFASHLGVIREREAAIRQLAAARELEAGNRTRTALLAAVSHDLRTPLAALRAAAETLRLSAERLDAQDRDQLLAAIEESTSRLTAMVSDLLDMSRLQTGAVTPRFEDVPLGEVVRRAAVGLPADRIAVGTLPVAHVDAGLLERAVANVLANAVRYSDRVEVAGGCSGSRVELRVRDHGPGVPPADRSRVFEPFQRLGDVPGGEGVGLGLAVARGLVEAQGGAITLGDTPGGGLTVVVELGGPNR
jgi:two-component system sensor histidine kinase KdpD